MTKIIAVLFYLAFFVNVKSEDECVTRNTTYICNCVSNETLSFYAERLDDPTFVEVRGCTSVLVGIFVGPLRPDIMQDFVFENITKELEYGFQTHRQSMKSFKLLNINNVKWQNSFVFVSLKRLDNFHAENTKMESFGEILKETDIKNFTLKNVTIGNLQAIQLNSTHGEYLNIVDCRIKINDNGIFIFKNFRKISIRKTIFEFSAPGNMTIIGGEVILNRITFVNMTVDVTGIEKIDMRGTCALGKKSRVILRSPKITSHANKGFNEIKYEPEQSTKPKTNTVCVDDDWDCCSNNELSDPNHAGSIQRSSFLLAAFVSYSLLAGI